MNGSSGQRDSGHHEHAELRAEEHRDPGQQPRDRRARSGQQERRECEHRHGHVWMREPRGNEQEQRGGPRDEGPRQPAGATHEHERQQPRRGHLDNPDQSPHKQRRPTRQGLERRQQQRLPRPVVPPEIPVGPVAVANPRRRLQNEALVVQQDERAQVNGSDAASHAEQHDRDEPRY
jgi:hypothetical protein